MGADDSKTVVRADNATATEKSGWKQLAAAVFSVPAGIAVLDKYEPRLGLSDLLKDIVRNYRDVIVAVWDQIGLVIELPPGFDVQFWSFTVLIVTIVAAESLRRWISGTTRPLARPDFWGIASSAAFVGLLIAFSTTAQFAVTIVEIVLLLGSLLLAGLIVYIGLLLGGYLITKVASALGKSGEETASTLIDAVPDWVGFVLCMVAFYAVGLTLQDLMMGPLYDWSGLARPGRARSFALLAAVGVFVLIAFGNLRSPAFAFFWAFGIFVVDWAATDFVPDLRAFLDSASSGN